MIEVARLALLLGSGGVALTLVGAVAVWSMEETRRIRRGLKAILGGEPHAFLTAPDQGRGAGFNFTSNTLAVAWDLGAWGLVYRLDELAGAELIVDGQVVGRVHRGEVRRALDRIGALSQVRLRLVFDDLAYPDFDLDLWSTGNEHRRNAPTAEEALEEANRWLARTEALLRRQTGVLPKPVARLREPVAAERAQVYDSADFDDGDG
jgi:hypothetical protein